MYPKLHRLVRPPGRTAIDQRTRGLFIRAILLGLGICLFLLTAWPALAAAQLAYFTGISEPESLVLEWATLREVNVASWNVYCKDELQLPEAYHLIGAVEALGGPDQGYAYSFPVPDLTPSVSYCFRLDEITLDGRAGESYDLCGLGYGVTPTPTPPENAGAGVVEDRAYGPGTPIPGNPAALPQDVASLPTSTPTIMAFSDVPVGDSPLATPTSYTESPPDSPAPIADGSTEPGRGRSILRLGSSRRRMLPADHRRPPTALPDPGYIVVTSTPTSEAVAQLMPTFTPLPTATMQSDTLLAQLTDVNADNLLLATLCFVFFGATGIGVLGITSLGLYFRSRSGSDERRR